MKILLFLALLLPALAWGAVDTLTCGVAAWPDADWNVFGAATDSVAVAPQDDDSTSYIYSYIVGDRQKCPLSASSIPEGSTLDSVKVSARIGAGYADAGILEGLGIGASETPSDSVWSDGLGIYETQARTIARPGGGAWTTGGLDSLDVFVTKIGATEHTIGVTTLMVLVYYTEGGEPPAPAAGSFFAPGMGD